MQLSFKVLVTGGAGYIGSHASLYLVQQGYEVIILDKFIYNQKFDHKWANVIKGDYGDKNLLKKIFSEHKIDAVMHFGAFIEVGESVKDPYRFYENNVSKTVALLNCMNEFGIKKFIFSSSCAVYGIPQEIPITENCECNPINPYGKTKFFVEEILKDFDSAYGIKFVALRYFNAASSMHGLKEFHVPETHLIPLLVQSVKNDSEFKIFGDNYDTPDGTCIRDFLHVWDIAEAHYLALKYLKEDNSSDFFNLGTGKGYSVLQVIKTLESLINKQIKYNIYPKRPGDPAMLVADANKALQALKWQPKNSDLDLILKSIQSELFIAF